MLETSQLQTVVAITQTGSFSKAAEKLHVTQSAISQSVKNIEKKLGVEIFRRTGRKVLLTAEGEKVYHLAQTFMKEMENTLSEIKNDQTEISGKVRIGTLTGVGKSWLAPQLIQLAKRFEHLTLVIKIGFMDDIIDAYEKGELDIVILPENYLPEEGERTFLSAEKATLVFPKEWSNQITEGISSGELEELPTILFEEDDYLYIKWFQEHFKRKPHKIKSRYIVNVHGNILQAVAEGLGTAVVPLHVYERSSYKDQVGTIGREFEIDNFNFYIVYRKKSLALARMKEVINYLSGFDSPLC